MELSVYSSERFMKQAFQEAEAAYEKGEIPVGAVVVCKNRIIARAHNQTELLNDATAHAEMIALTAAANFLGGKYLNDCSIYVTLEPCAMCAGALFWTQIGKLAFAVEDPVRGYSTLKGNLLHPRTKVEKGIMRMECKEIIDRFFNNLRE